MEQMVGLARVSDLTVFWLVLAVFAVLPVVMNTPREQGKSSVASVAVPKGPPSQPVPRQSGYASRRTLWLLLVVLLIGGIGILTWVKTVNYPRAARIVATAVKQAEEGNLQGSLSSYERATDLGPDVWINYNRQAAVYQAYSNSSQTAAEPECRPRAEGRSYEACLAEKAYSANLAGVEQRPYNFRAHHTLANSALNVARLTGSAASLDAAFRFFDETADLVPNAWPLYDQLVLSQA